MQRRPSDRHRRGNMRLRRVILDREILEPVIEYARRPAKDAQFRRAFGHAPQLLFDQLGVIEIEMHVAAGPDDFMPGEVRSEERRVGKEWVSRCRTWVSPFP